MFHCILWEFSYILTTKVWALFGFCSRETLIALNTSVSEKVSVGDIFISCRTTSWSISVWDKSSCVVHSLILLGNHFLSRYGNFPIFPSVCMSVINLSIIIQSYYLLPKVEFIWTGLCETSLFMFFLTPWHIHFLKTHTFLFPCILELGIPF